MCIYNNILEIVRSKCEASTGHGVVLHQSGYSKGFNVAVFRNTQADYSVLDSALKGFGIDRIWKLIPLNLKEYTLRNRYIKMYIYIYINLKMFFMH